MRTFWNIASFLAVVHLLALGLFAGWLWQSGRLSSDRLENARQLFSASIADEQAAAAKAEQEAKAEKGRQAQQERQANPAFDSASQADAIALIKQQEAQSRRRLEAERNSLQQQLILATARVNQQQEELDRQRALWEQTAKGDQQRKNDEQFMLIVRQYEQLPPKQGKRMLMELIEKNEKEQATAYLSAMSLRAASKILKEFKTDEEIALATELLESLRTHGQETAQETRAAVASNLGAGSGPGADSTSNAGGNSIATP